MEAFLAVGFGAVTVRRDDEIVWTGVDPSWRVRRVEKKAAVDPDHDWRIKYYAPLYESIYQRQGPKKWILIGHGKGFA